MKNKINALRRRRGLSPKALTRKFQAQINRRRFEEDFEFVRKAEAGSDIPIKDAHALAKALGVAVSTLYG